LVGNSAPHGENSRALWVLTEGYEEVLPRHAFLASYL
jgi:hypothetical protein